jgi:cytochrome c biogenesis protein CcmG/thiol:disulfide interchange protein DsbE
MKRVALYLVPLVGFIVLAAFLMRGLWLNPREVPSPLIGKPAPVFERTRLDTLQTTFSSKELLGQVWVLNVWASWCGPCRVEHPLWNAFAKKKIAPLVGLNYKDMPDNARKFLNELGDPYTLTVIDYDGKLGIDFGVYGVPETFIIDKQGIVRFKHIGPVSPDVMTKKIEPLLQELART